MKGITSGNIIIIAQSKSCGAATSIVSITIAKTTSLRSDHKYSWLYCGFDS
jgi:hypothetical protein